MSNKELKKIRSKYWYMERSKLINLLFERKNDKSEERFILRRIIV